MRNNFDFYEIVKIETNEIEYSEINGTYGIILGIGENYDGTWGYSVACEKECWDLPENILVKTGRFTTRENIHNGESIKVLVDKDGNATSDDDAK